MKQTISLLGDVLALSCLVAAVPFMLGMKAYRKLTGKKPARPINIFF